MSPTAVEFANLVLRHVHIPHPTTDHAHHDHAGHAHHAEHATPACGNANEYDGRKGLRISAIFVIFVASTLATLFPVIAKRHPRMKVPDWVFFFSKYFGSGVIIATAFIHLLTPANEALTNPCLAGPITKYPWAEGISMISVFVIFFVELLVMRLAGFSPLDHGHNHAVGPDTKGSDADANNRTLKASDPESLEEKATGKKEHTAQLLSFSILEFGIVFHSIFIGLTLAVSGAEFEILYVVIVFHQCFEGLGLGSRLSAITFANRWTPYIMGFVYGASTPVALGIGLAVRNSFNPASRTALLMNGIFDAISSGMLLFTGLVELMAHEFLFGKTLRDASLARVLCAFGFMVLGAMIMALLGKWA